ncbi:hypothetical protein D3C85_1297780 [compost metagenome]
MKKIILLTSVAVASGVLFANIYTSMVIAVATDGDIPNSVIAGGEFFKVANPGDFFKIFSPASQVLTLISLVLFWKNSKKTRLFLGLALLCFISGDIMAFTYFHPRTDLLFSNPMPDVETLKRLSSEWSAMNWGRSLILLIGLVFSFLAVDKIYSTANQN